jgi:hypothetical protein
VSLMKGAMELVNQRLTDPEIIKSAQGQDELGYHWLTPNLVSATAQDAYPYAPDYQGVLWRQLSALKNARIKPPVILMKWDGRNFPNTTGCADYDQVKIRFTNTGRAYEPTGEFHIFVNTSLCFRDADLSDPRFWATTIVHEMCHCLGHRHEDSLTSPASYRSRQMINFEQAFYASLCNRQYNKGMPNPFFASTGAPIAYCNCGSITP